MNRGCGLYNVKRDFVAFTTVGVPSHDVTFCICIQMCDKFLPMNCKQQQHSIPLAKLHTTTVERVKAVEWNVGLHCSGLYYEGFAAQDELDALLELHKGTNENCP